MLMLLSLFEDQAKKCNKAETMERNDVHFIECSAWLCGEFYVPARICSSHVVQALPAAWDAGSHAKYRKAKTMQRL